MTTSLTFGTHSLQQSWRPKVQHYAILMQFLCYKKTGMVIPDDSYPVLLIQRSCFPVRKAHTDTNLLLPTREPDLLMCIGVLVLSFAVSKLVGSAESTLCQGS